jgi:hypothetical protein
MASPVAPNADNTLTIPVRRLPLGVPVPSPPGPTRWRVWIPTYLGGELTIRCSDASQVEIQQPDGNSLASGTAEAVTFAAFGECFVATTTSGGMIIASLVQTAWSRMHELLPNKPLLPWNFYYWPARRSSAAADEARDILKRYASAVGKSPDVADTFEHDSHQSPDAAGWAGHCHHAAPASALFEQPVATTIGGQFFSEEEMEFLATEWFGNFGQVQDPSWTLRNTRFPHAIGRWDVLGYLKPGGPKDRATLTKSLGGEFDPSTAVAAGEVWSIAVGSEAEFKDWINKDFGKAAAGYFQKLQDELAANGLPLLSNLRSYEPHRGPEEVWNQMIFYYRATFSETWPQNPQDDKDLKVSCEVYSNIDTRPSPNLAGRFASGSVIPGQSSKDAWLYRNEWRIIFDGQGKINASDDRNAWTSLQNDQRQELFAPTNLNLLGPPASVRRTGPPFGTGNPVVGMEFLKYATINARYK